jgi:molybdopterin molybdotransferase
MMISFETAQEIVFEHSLPFPETLSLIGETTGQILAEDIFSPIDLPPFRQSSMDGYAVIHSGPKRLKLLGEMPAGSRTHIPVEPGTAVRIFTGSAVPEGADCIAIQEEVEVQNGFIELQNPDLKAGMFIRDQGEQLKAGELALSKGTFISPAVIGFLAGMGLTKVRVFRRPRVSVVVTGSELVTPGNSLEFGQIFESNSFALGAALSAMDIRELDYHHIRDEHDKTLHILSEALKRSDIILVTGGISVGKYDFVRDVMSEIGVEEVFYRVAQKPGKPMYYGKKGDKRVFGLPGNPASSLVCFYNFVYPAIRKGMGYTGFKLKEKQLSLVAGVQNNTDRMVFLRANADGNHVESLEGQESFMMKSFAEANALLVIPPEKTGLEAGEKVKVLMLP